MQGTVLLSGEASIYYFTGFYTTAMRPKQIGSTAVILGDGVKKFVIPQKWQFQIQEQNLEDTGELICYANTTEAYKECLKKILGQMDHHQIWIEYNELDIYSYQMLVDMGGEILDITEELAKLRLIKSKEEIQKLRQSAKIATAAMEYAKNILSPGIKELEAVAEIEYYMRKRGSDGVPFTMKLLSGKQSSLVTRVPGNKLIEEGDLVLLDFGAKINGYSSDWTRTFCIGEADKEKQELYDFVWCIQRECIAMIKPGLPMSRLVKKAFEIAEKHPYGKFLNPHLGHSVGITSHEWPVIEPGVKEIFQKNMVITIEPGVYLPGLGGVRIEDEILVTEYGYELLTGLKEEGLSLQNR